MATLPLKLPLKYGGLYSIIRPNGTYTEQDNATTEEFYEYMLRKKKGCINALITITILSPALICPGNLQDYLTKYQPPNQFRQLTLFRAMNRALIYAHDCHVLAADNCDPDLFYLRRILLSSYQTLLVIHFVL